MRQIGIQPDHLHPADIDETPYKKEHPRFLARRLAYNKALKVQEEIRMMEDYKFSYILSADTVVSVGRMILPKPQHEDEARECLKLLSGRTHKVHTAICLITPHGRAHRKLVENRLRFSRLSPSVIDAYVATEEWQGKAGGYAIQGFAGSFVLRLVGSYSGVMGLPLAETFRLLESQSYPVHSQWGKSLL